MINQTPQHIAIILDGNRRFAERLMLQPWKGHKYGQTKVEKILNYAKELKIKQLTFYALSYENIKKRPKSELNYIYKIFRKAFKKLDEKKIKKNNIRINFIGNLNLLPKDLQKQCRILEFKTLNNNCLIVNFAIAYSGKQEIIYAIKKILKNKASICKITEQTIQENLYLADNPDLIIRTGGEKRTSNFLPWQSAYSEWIFLNKMWPEFEKQDLIKCIKEFKLRKRNFGA